VTNPVVGDLVIVAAEIGRRTETGREPDQAPHPVATPEAVS
jgi:hypothetical protein